MISNTTKIDKDKFYTASEVMKMGILPWKSTKSFHSYLVTDQWIELLKPVITQGNKNKRYFIKGENLLSLIEKINKGEVQV